MSGGVESRDVVLRDGATVTLRPIGADDKERMERAFQRLSEESRYRRFFTAVTELSSADLAYLTEVDHHDHEAIVAIEPATGEGIGVARYVRSATSPAEAEVAVTVVDDWQGQGVGGALLERLVERAREEGVRRFAARALAENRAAIAVLETLGETERLPDGREVELSIDLPPSGIGRQLSRALREAATGSLVVSGVFLYRVTWAMARPFPRRRGRGRPKVGTRTIVVGTDGSPDAQRAVATAIELAQRLGSRLHIASAYSPAPQAILPDEPVALPEALSRLQWAITPRENAEAAVAAAVTTARDTGLEPVTHTRPGEPADILIALADEHEADLLVVGSRGPDGTTRFRFGGVADQLSHHAPCSVLLVRE